MLPYFWSANIGDEDYSKKFILSKVFLFLKSALLGRSVRHSGSNDNVLSLDF